MDIYVGLTRAKAIETFEHLLDAARTDSLRGLDEAIYAEPNMMTGVDEIIIHFTNEDMEDRPEVAEKIFVDVEA